MADVVGHIPNAAIVLTDVRVIRREHRHTPKTSCRGSRKVDGTSVKLPLEEVTITSADWEALASDCQALASDWVVVGQDMRKAIETYVERKRTALPSDHGN